MKKLILMPIMLLLFVALASAAPVDMKVFKLPNSNSSSLTFVTIGTEEITLLSESNVTVIGTYDHINLGSITNGDIELRILFNGQVIGQISNDANRNDDTFTDMILGNISNVGVGTHTIVIQRRNIVTTDVIEVRNLDFAINTYQLNSAPMNVRHYNFFATFEGQAGIFTKIAEGTFTNKFSGDVIALATLEVNDKKGEFIFEFDHINGTTFEAKADFITGQAGKRTNNTEGIKDWAIYATVGGNGIGTVNASFFLWETNTTSGELSSNFSATDGTVITLTSEFQLIESHNQFVSAGNGIYPVATFGAEKLNNAETEYFIGISNASFSQNGSIYRHTIGGGEEKRVMLSSSEFINLGEGVYNVTVFGRGIAGLPNLIIDSDLLSWEFNNLVFIDNPPNVTLISPPDLSTVVASDVTFEAFVSDDNIVMNATLFHNASGIFQIESFQTVGVPSTTVFFNETFTENAVILWNVKAWDDFSQQSFAPNNFTFTLQVPDTFPPVITLISPANGTVTNIIPLDITFNVADASSNATCVLQNSTNVFDNVDVLTGFNANLTLAKGVIAISQQFPNLELTCSDNTLANNSATLNLNYTLDVIPPLIIIISPANESSFNTDIVSNINIKANCIDFPVLRFNITVANSSDTIASFEAINPINNQLSIDEQISTSGLGSGNYTVTHVCADPHTAKQIGNYQVIKSKENKEGRIKWLTPSNNEYELKCKSDDDLGILNYGSSKHQDNTKYGFWYVFNKTEDGSDNTYTCELENNKFGVTYLPNSKFVGHFTMQDNWLDMDFGDPDAQYQIALNPSNNYEIHITTKKTTLNFSSTGDLNIAIVTTQFELFFVKQIEDFFNVTVCQTDTGSVIMLVLFFFLALFFVWLGIAHQIGFVGFFGAVLMMILSWFIAACIGVFALIIALLSFVLMIFFVIGNLGFKNRTFIP